MHALQSFSPPPSLISINPRRRHVIAFPLLWVRKLRPWGNTCDHISGLKLCLFSLQERPQLFLCLFRIPKEGDSEALCLRYNVFPHLWRLKLARTMFNLDQKHHSALPASAFWKPQLCWESQMWSHGVRVGVGGRR